MEYRFILTYTPTDGAALPERICHPDYSNDLAVVIEMQADEWYRTRKLDGKLTFRRDDYTYIVDTCPFDGSFLLTIQCSTDGGTTWQDYLSGTFSRANLEIDEDNRRATLTGITESGEYKIIDNARREEYDLMKIIPDSDAREVEGQVHPALAMVDYNTSSIDYSDMYCDAPILAGGYTADESGYTTYTILPPNSTSWLEAGLFAEAIVKMVDPDSPLNGIYVGQLTRVTIHDEQSQYGYIETVLGELHNKNNCTLKLVARNVNFFFYPGIELYDENGQFVMNKWHQAEEFTGQTPWGFFPAELKYKDSDQPAQNPPIFISADCFYHYIFATLLTQSGGVADNVLDTGDYYQRMAAFEGSGLNVVASSRTVNQPNGHRLIPGTGEQGTIPQYFAPPDNDPNWIPLAENNWNYGSLWYTIQPSVQNGLLAPANFGSFRWTRCWELGTCLNHLLQKITNGKVTFSESTAGSEYLYADVNPVTGGEPFRYLFTQKSNVMRPSNSGESAARCTVTLDWFLELLRNAFNCHWWLEPVNGGTYAFRVEHVEYFRRGGSYTGQLTAQLNLSALLPRRNYQRDGLPAKHLDDQQHRYTYDMNGMTEKYTFSWQGDGGSDAFKGHPMFFKAGWIERGTTDDHQVDNIFADLPWLMLNAGTDTASSKNYEGLFIFSGYRRQTADWTENHQPLDRYLILAEGPLLDVDIILWCSAPAGHIIRFALVNGQTTTLISEHTATGNLQPIAVQYAAAALTSSSLVFDFGTDYADVFIHRIHARGGYLYNIPNTINRLSDPANPTYMQNGALAWPYLQNEHLHFNIPSQKWSFNTDDIDDAQWNTTGTVKLCKKQNTTILPMPTQSDEQQLDHGVIGGLRDSQGNYLVGIVENAKINLTSRNCELKIMYDIIT